MAATQLAALLDKLLHFGIVGPWEGVEQLPEASGVLFGPALIQFYGLVPDL